MLNYFFKIFSMLWGSKKKFMLPLGYSVVCTWRPMFLPIMGLHVVIIIRLTPTPFFFFFFKLLGRDRHWLGWLSTCQWQDLWLSCLLIWEQCNAFLSLITNKAILNTRSIGNRGKRFLGREQHDSVHYNWFEKQVLFYNKV